TSPLGTWSVRRCGWGVSKTATIVQEVWLFGYPGGKPAGTRSLHSVLRRASQGYPIRRGIWVWLWPQSTWLWLQSTVDFSDPPIKARRIWRSRSADFAFNSRHLRRVIATVLGRIRRRTGQG